MKLNIVLILSVMLSNHVFAQKICVFDPLGSAGELFFIMKDYSIFAKSMNINIELIPYKEEERAVDAFKKQICEALMITDISARQFNSFSGSMNAIGAIKNHQVAKAVLNLMDHPKLASDLQQSGIEVAGFLPIGIVRLITNNRNINHLKDVHGENFAVISGDIAQYQMVKRIGGNPVSAHINEFPRLLEQSKVSIVGLPALALEPFEILRIIGKKGGITDYPATFVSMNLLIKQDRFPDGFGLKSRSWFKNQYDLMFKKIELAESKINPEYWIKIEHREAEGYDRIVREMRLRLIKEGVYHKKMLALLKKLRCQQDHTQFECGKLDE